MTLRDFLDAYAELLCDAMAMFFGAWIVFAFIMILTTGSFVGIESRTWLAKIELVVGFLVFLLGLWRMVGDIQDFKSKRSV